MRKYLKDISKYLVCSGKQKKEILKNIEASVVDYVSDNNITDIQDVYKHFGNPEEIAKTYLGDIADPADVRKAIGKKKLLIIVALIALTILLVALTIALIDGHFTHSGYIIEGTPQEMLIYTMHLFDKGVLL